MKKLRSSIVLSLAICAAVSAWADDQDTAVVGPNGHGSVTLYDSHFTYQYNRPAL